METTANKINKQQQKKIITKKMKRYNEIMSTYTEVQQMTDKPTNRHTDRQTV